MNYRERCYSSYARTQWSSLHSMTIEEYDFLRKIFAKRYVKFLPLDKEARIIDVACGPGHFLYFLKEEGYTNITGLDISPEQVEQARKVGLNEVQEADLSEYLSKNNRKFELIIANDIIEHLKKKRSFGFPRHSFCLP